MGFASMASPSAKVEVVSEVGIRVPVALSSEFVSRIRYVVEAADAGYLDVADFIRSALRKELDIAERGLFGKRKRWG